MNNSEVITTEKKIEEKPANVSGLPSSIDALKIKCLEIANSFSGSMNAVEDNYNRLLSLVNLSK